MHLAYSALQQTTVSENQQYAGIKLENHQHEPLLRYRAYEAACQKYSEEITAIQKYIPGWMPAFR
jgi:hypothetical protein